MPQFRLRRAADRRLYSVSKDMDLHTEAKRRMHAPGGHGLLKVVGAFVPSRLVRNSERWLMVVAIGALVLASTYFLFRCVQFVFL